LYGGDDVDVLTGVAPAATGVRRNFAGRLVLTFADGTDSLVTVGLGKDQIWVLGFAYDYMRTAGERAAVGSPETALPARPVPCAPFGMKMKRYGLHTKSVGL
jgi:hypothetical protein